MTAVLCTLIVLSAVFPLPVGHKLLSIGTSYEVSAQGDPWLSGWNKRIKLTTNSSLVGSNLTHFPIMVSLKSGNGETTKIFDELQSDANRKKIAVTTSDGETQCYVEIEKWDDANEQAVLWVKAPTISSSADTDLYLYYDADHADNTDYVGDIGSLPAQIVWNENAGFGKYLTSWSKSDNNPLQNIGSPEGWMCSCYSNYNNEDKIYIFYHNSTTDNLISCWSFTRANAGNAAQWTDEGTVYTGTSDQYHIEPHGIIFETQAMADAREGVGEGQGTRKWRMYVCCRGSEEGVGDSDIHMLYASESDLTSWTSYGSVYQHDATYGYGDPKVCIYDDEVWMLIGAYASGSCHHSFFTHSSDGISSWTDIGTELPCSYLIGTLIGFTTGILIDDHAPTTGNHGHSWRWTTDGSTISSYSGNPFLSGAGGWDIENGWSTTVVDKDGSPDLADAGTYYFYWWGTGDGHQLGLATSTTLTQEANSGNFKIVLHMKDKTTSSVEDSSPNSNDGTKLSANNPIEYSSGKIGKAQDFSDDYITIPFGLSPPYTVEFWANPDDISGSGVILGFGDTTPGGAGVALGFYSGTDEIVIGNDGFKYGLDDVSAYLTNGVWQHWVDVVNSASDIDFYLDGAAKSLDTTTYWSNAAGYRQIGARYRTSVGYERYFDGKVDEVRISNVARNAAWIKATYETERDNLLTYGNEETKTPEITNAPGTYGFGTVAVGGTANTSINYFTITNTGSVAVDVTIQGTDATGGDDTWTLSDTATPGENIYGLKAGLDDGDDSFDVVVKKNTPYNTLVSNLAEDATQDWGLKLWMPTSLSGYDNQQMTATITLVASEAS